VLGVVRFALAMSVVVFHLTGTVPNLGLLAVSFFYVISGYLITMVLHESYRFRLGPFAANRLLRLYPAYLAMLLAGVASSRLPGHATFHQSWAEPAGPVDVAANVLVVPWAFLGDPAVNVDPTGLLTSTGYFHRVIPSSWSIAVELVCYALLWLVVARRPWTAVATIAAGAAWHGWVFAAGMDPALAYFPVAAALLPFGCGALAYHLTQRLRMPQLDRGPAIGVTVVVLAAFIGIWWWSLRGGLLVGSVPYYANTLLAFATVLTINRTRHRGRAATVDRWLGDLAYPVFLGHYVFAFIAWWALGGDGPTRGWGVFAMGALTTVAASAVVVKVVDRRVARLRDRVRRATASRPAADDREPEVPVVAAP
jgi:peptidoglycan/LPS O-acetylase OafA/YrhL